MWANGTAGDGRVRIQSAVLDILGFHLPAYSFLFAIGIENFFWKSAFITHYTHESGKTQIS